MFNPTQRLRLKQKRQQLTNRLKEDLSDVNIFIQNIDKKVELIVTVLTFLFIGTLGYVLIEGWSVLDSFYMVIITMSTIGYGEVRTLSTEGRLFTMVLIIIGVIVGSYAASATIETLTSDNFHRQRRNLQRRRQLRRISDHTIICGFGRLGRSLAEEMRGRDSPIIVIECNPQVVRQCEEWQIPYIEGNAAEEPVLIEAGIERAKALVAAANSDAENVFIILSAGGLNPNLEIISRYNYESSIPKLKRAGANSVISPHVLAGGRVAQMITNPRITQFLDGALQIGNQQLRLADFIIAENSSLVGKTLREARLAVNVLAVSRPNQNISSHPNADTLLLPGVEIVVMGLDAELKYLAQLVSGDKD